MEQTGRRAGRGRHRRRGGSSPWLMPALFVALITRVQIITEEQALGTLFGEQYLAYRRRTARWIGVAR
jgi:protein-S-isoprenylcysteine O-methyltransferase Ste14